MRVFTDSDGLPQNSVQAVTIDRGGYLWVGTQDGAARYNGRAWSVINLPNKLRSNSVRSLLATSDGSIWFGTLGGGVARLTGDGWTVFDSATGLPHDEVRCLFESSDTTIWVGTTKGGLASFDGSRWRHFEGGTELSGTGVTSLTETVDSTGRRLLWAGTLFGGLACFDGRAWSSFDIAPEDPQHNNVLSLVEASDQDGRRILWVGSALSLHKFDIEQRKFIWEHDRSGASFMSLLRTKAHRGHDIIWAGSGRGSLLRIENGAITPYGEASGLPDTRIFCLVPADAPHRPGMLWIGTDAGLVLLNEHAWWSIDERSGIPHKVVWAFATVHAEDRSPTIAIGTDGGGAAVLEPSGWRVINEQSGLPNDIVWEVVETHWENEPVLRIGTELGLASRIDDRWEILDHATGLPHFAIRALVESVDTENAPALWIATGAGVSRLERNGLIHFDASSGLPVDEVWCLLETAGERGARTLWVGSRGAGLARLERGVWSLTDASSGLPNNSVLCIHESRSEDGERTLWVGTQGGGVAYRSLSGANTKWNVLGDSSTPALPNNTVYQICEDARGRLYLSTNKGIARLTPRTPTANDPARYSIFTFTVEDGLPSNECNAGASIVDTLGRIWVGTVEGIAVFDPSEEIEDSEPKPLHIERVRLNGAEVDPNRLGPLSHDENNLEFEYAMLSFRRERDTRYRTRLLGFDSEWSDWTPDYRRTYTNLPRGVYEFRVCGRDSSGNVGDAVSVAFRIKSAPWRTWWAYVAYGAAILGAGYGGMRYRMRSLQQQSERLTSLVDERTAELASTVDQLRDSEQRALDANRAKSVFLSNMSHELRTPLNAVIGLASLLERDQSLTDDQHDTLAVIHRSGDHLLGLINDVLSLSKIEAGKITFNLQPFDLRRLLDTVLEMTRIRAESKSVEIEFRLDDSLPRTVLGDESKLRQVLINLIGNAVKFTDTGRVEVRIHWASESGRAAFEVEDTGRGIAEEELGMLFQEYEQTTTGVRSKEGSGLGLVISREIVRLMNGDIWVQSMPGVGSIFGFEIDLPATVSTPLPSARRVIALAPSQPEWRVLVADDTFENRLVLTKLLALIGIQAREAANGKEAVRIWQEWRPHLVWMDVRMSEMDGLEATRRIRSAELKVLSAELKTPDTETDAFTQHSAPSTQHSSEAINNQHCKIIALTASVFDHEREAMLAAGADDLVLKPFQDSTIFAKLEEHLGVAFVRDAASAESPEEHELSLGRISALPANQANAIYDALWVGDAETALQAVDEVQAVDPPLANTLAHLIRGYRFKEVLEALRPDTQP